MPLAISLHQRQVVPDERSSQLPFPQSLSCCRRPNPSKKERTLILAESQNNSDIEQAARTTMHGGRRPGANNYKDIDLDELLNLTERELPLGQKGWQKISSRFKTWAKANNRPVRDTKSLETKFKQVSLFSFAFLHDFVMNSIISQACQNYKTYWRR
jgi:hypothetical protein